MNKAARAATWLLIASVITAFAFTWAYLLATAPGTFERLMCIPLAGVLIAISTLAIILARQV